MPTPYRLAVVEDDPGLLADLVEFLALRKFAPKGFASAEELLAAWPDERFDLMLLDVVLPGASGLDVARAVRAKEGEGATVGIVMLTALEANEDHLQGLGAGADVYLSKRSSLEVIEAACHSLLRRLESPAARGPAASGGRWTLDARRWRLLPPRGEVIELTFPEVVLLGALFERPGQAVGREELLARLGKRETLQGLRNLENTASRLRRKVQAASGSEFPVRPSYGKGYTFAGPCEVA